ncbi:hypothetical protein [Parvibaculum sp.]|nr:hypothetical protein [Parvibaculum sp.]MBO6693546.1 hypothetical protein [Parvibaculum sp.]MBO6715301.1 hypothetical protein [Parvibaculum sp.]
MRGDAYFDSPWPAEDGGAMRLASTSTVPLNIQPDDRLQVTRRRTQLSTMTILGAPGEVFLLTHSAMRAQLGFPTSSRVTRVDAQTLKTISKSPRLPGGRMWPGGMALHRNGDLYVVYGNHAHRLDRGLSLRASLTLPHDLPYNSFVVLDCGLLVCKNISDRVAARLCIIDPDTLRPVCAGIDCPEPSIARLSARGDTVYVVGVKSIFRYHWDRAACRLIFDDGWRHDYATGTQQSYGWDVVLARDHAWFMDNGHHRYRISMIGAGVSLTPNRLIRVSLHDSSDHDSIEVSGLGGGSITNPPVFDIRRQIVVAMDSANKQLRAWRFNAVQRTLTPIWRRTNFGAASHMLLYPSSGELVTNDYHDGCEYVAVLDIVTGENLARAKIGAPLQGVVFPSPGWGRDFFWCSMGFVARVAVAQDKPLLLGGAETGRS